MDLEHSTPGAKDRHCVIDRPVREAEVEELYDAVVKGRPVFHGGRWGAATSS